MLGSWLRRRIQISSVRRAQEDLERFVESLRGASDEELGTLVAVATLIRLRLTKSGSLPKNSFALPSPGDGLARVPLRLANLVREFQKQGQPSDAAGTMVWLHSMRALTFPEVRHLGRQMWQELQRGFPYAPEALREIGSLSEEEVAWEACTFIPDDLSPVSVTYEQEPSQPKPEADDAVDKIIEMGKMLGAKTAREAAEMAQGRPLTDAEWERYRESWERNWF